MLGALLQLVAFPAEALRDGRCCSELLGRDLRLCDLRLGEAPGAVPPLPDQGSFRLLGLLRVLDHVLCDPSVLSLGIEWIHMDASVGPGLLQEGQVTLGDDRMDVPRALRPDLLAVDILQGQPLLPVERPELPEGSRRHLLHLHAPGWLLLVEVQPHPVVTILEVRIQEPGEVPLCLPSVGCLQAFPGWLLPFCPRDPLGVVSHRVVLPDLNRPSCHTHLFDVWHLILPPLVEWLNAVASPKR